MTSGAAIGIICKAPRPGKSKTRLIPVLGAEFAARLSACFLQDIAATIMAIEPGYRAMGYAVYAPEDAEAEVRGLMPEGFGVIYHGADVLGAVLANAVSTLLARAHDCVLLVNSDSPTLPASFLQQAIAALREDGDRVVFGPATDGGYYLMGLKANHARLFEDVPWSTQHVLSKSIERAADIGLAVVLLETWYDVDDAESLDYLREELAGVRPICLPAGTPGGLAPATRALLQSIDNELRGACSPRGSND